MDPLDQYPLDRGPAPPPSRAERPAGTRVAVGALLLGVALLLIVVWWRSGPSSPDTVQRGAAVPAAEATPRAPLGPAVDPRDLPPLDASDPLVRQLLGALSARPEVVAWLATDGLVRNFVVSVDNVANGHSPARHLKPLAPAAPFAVERRGAEIVIDPRSYDRYTALADTVASLDAAALARLYATLKPRLEEAYRELGTPDGNIDTAVERAIVGLLQTPIPAGQTTVTPGIVSYRFEDGRIESRSAAEKQLLRMGPQNARRIQAQLRALAQELGIPPARLPAPGT
jgi:hypothetical protein